MPNFINGTAGSDVLRGTLADDDYLQGLQGNDTIDGGVGANDIAAWVLPQSTPGSLRVVEGVGADAGKLLVQRVNGSAVDTVFEVSRSGEAFVVRGVGVAASLGTDLVTNVDGLHFLFNNQASTPGRFVDIRLTPVADAATGFIAGGVYADVIGVKRMLASAGAEATVNVNAGLGDDIVVGHAGANGLRGEAGADVLIGGRGDDYLAGGEGDDELDGGRGNGDVAVFHLPAGTTGALRVVEGAGAEAGKLLVQLVDGSSVQTVFEIALIGTEATVRGVGLAAGQGTDAATAVEELHFLPDAAFDATRFASVSLRLTTPAIAEGAALVSGSATHDIIDLASLYGSAGAAADLRADGGWGDDLIVGTEGVNGFLQGGSGDDTIRGGGGADVLVGGAGNDLLDGGAGEGDAAAFRLAPGLAGSLRLVEGGPSLLLVQRVVGGAVETVFEVSLSPSGATARGVNSAAGLGTDTAYNVDRLEFAFEDEPFDPARFLAIDFAPFVGPVQDGAAFVAGTGFADVLNLGALYPEADAAVKLGADGAQGHDLLVGHLGENALAGGLGDDTLLGGAGDDLLVGGSGNDSLDGGAGARDAAQWLLPAGTVGALRVVEGVGAEDGRLFVERVAGASVERLFEVTVTGATARVVGLGSAVDLGTDIVSNVDQLQFFVANEPFDPDQSATLLLSPIANPVGEFGGFVTGSVLADQVFLGAFYAGELRIDMDGGLGDDLVVGHGGTNGVLGGLGDDTLLGAGGADTLSGGLGKDSLEGGDGNDELLGEEGDDTLVAGSGDDMLAGATGTDRFDGGDGFDRVRLGGLTAGSGVRADLRVRQIGDDGHGATETLAGVEGLIGATRFVDLLRGDDLANFLAIEAGDTAEGFGGNDTIELGAAAALVDGGDGVDTVSFQLGRLVDADGDSLAEIETSVLGVVVDLSAQAIVDDGFGEGGVLLGIENLAGTASADVLTGDLLANQLDGRFGDDTLAGSGGGDTLLGGEGLDSLDGGEGGDELRGQAGDDTLEGGAGDDVLYGGEGVDLASYAGAATAVSINLAASGPQHTSLGADRLIQVEGVIGSAFADVLAGSELGNFLRGGEGNDSLRGEAGDDTLGGGNGTDTLVGGAGFDTADYADAAGRVVLDLSASSPQSTGGAGLDTLSGMEGLAGSSFADRLAGDGAANLLSGVAGADILLGGGGNDQILGGLGADELTGGAGADVFAYVAVAESGAGPAARDRIRDFSRAEGDRIDLSAIDAVKGDADDSFVLATRFTTAGQLIVKSKRGDTTVEGHVDGDGVADFVLLLAGVTAPLTAADFVL